MSSRQNHITALLGCIKQHGLKKALVQTMIIMGFPKYGKLIGVDRFGNEYYENKQDVSGFFLINEAAFMS